MTPQETKAKIKRIIESNTTYTQVHQQADPTPNVNVKTLTEDLEMFVEILLKNK